MQRHHGLVNTQTPIRAAVSGPPSVPGFVLGEPVGRGATSTVWSGVRTETGQAVAVKVTTPARLHVGQLMELAARETAILARVDHDHLVRLHEAHPLPDGSVAVVLDLADGGNLAELVGARGRLAPGEVATICTPLAQALAALHAAGVIHGDLSPGNVVFTADGRPLLTDFDAARLVGESHPPQVAGTAGFVAPEVTGGDVPTEASDVFGLGALAWFALTGRPWGGPTMAAAGIAVGTGTPAGTATSSGTATAGGTSTAGGTATPGGAASAPVELGEARRLLGTGFADAVVSMLADDPAARPSAPEAAQLVFQAAAAVPVRLVPRHVRIDPDHVLTQRLRGALTATDVSPSTAGVRRGGRPGRHAAPRERHTRWWRAFAGRWRGSEGRGGRHAGLRCRAPGRWALARPAALASVLVVILALVASAAWRVSSAEAAASDDARVVLGELVAARGRALADRSADGLALADGPGSAQLAHDLDIVAALAEAGQRYVGLSFSVTQAEWLSTGATIAHVRAVVARSAYRVVGPGDAVHEQPSDAGTPCRYVLVRGEGGWRIADVTR